MEFNEFISMMDEKMKPTKKVQNTMEEENMDGMGQLFTQEEEEY